MVEQLGRALGALMVLVTLKSTEPLAEMDGVSGALHAALLLGTDLPTISAAAALLEVAQSAPLTRAVLDAAPLLLNTLVGLLTCGGAAAARSAAQVLVAFTCVDEQLAARVLEADGAVAGLIAALRAPHTAPCAAAVLRRLSSPVCVDRFVALASQAPGIIAALSAALDTARGPGEQWPDVRRRVVAAAGVLEALLSRSPELARVAAGTPGTLQALGPALTCLLKEVAASALKALGCIIHSGAELLQRVQAIPGVGTTLFRLLEGSDPSCRSKLQTHCWLWAWSILQSGASFTTAGSGLLRRRPPSRPYQGCKVSLHHLFAGRGGLGSKRLTKAAGPSRWQRTWNPNAQVLSGAGQVACPKGPRGAAADSEHLHTAPCGCCHHMSAGRRRKMEEKKRRRSARGGAFEAARAKQRQAVRRRRRGTRRQRRRRRQQAPTPVQLKYARLNPPLFSKRF
jgi:hypothetical protein